MPRRWQMQDAKARLAELIRRAAAEGPQIVTHRGVDSAVVISVEEYRRLETTRPSFSEHLLGGPKLDDEAIEMINHRTSDLGRDIDL
jgi:prevent-host-death family protein